MFVPLDSGAFIILWQKSISKSLVCIEKKMQEETYFTKVPESVLKSSETSKKTLLSIINL